MLTGARSEGGSSDPEKPRSQASRTAVDLNWGQRALQPTAAGVLGLGFALWGFWLGIRQLSDNSFFTHLATGRIILDTRTIPVADPYSYTAHGDPWVVQSWLASLLYGLVDSWAGPGGLRVLSGVLCAVISWLIWRLSDPANLLVRVAIVSMTMVVGTVMWAPRPLLFGMLFLGVTLLAAEGRVDPRWLVPVSWAWVNSHGSFPLGLVALGILYVGRRLDGEDPSNERRALAWAALGTALAVVNPLGPRVLVFPIELLRKSESLQQIIEWKSPSFLDGWTRIFLLQVMVTVLALVRRPSWRGGLATVVFLAASLLGVRNVAVASMVFVLIAAHALAGLGSLAGRDRSVAFALCGAVLVVILLAASSATFSRPHYDLTGFPVDAAAWLDERDALAKPDVMLAASDTTGNFLELLYGPEARVFMDDRVDMYPKQVVDELVAMINGGSGWREALDRHRVNVVLWSRSGPLPQLLSMSPEWRVLYEDGQSSVACRRGTEVGKLRC